MLNFLSITKCYTFNILLTTTSTATIFDSSISNIYKYLTFFNVTVYTQAIKYAQYES